MFEKQKQKNYKMKYNIFEPWKTLDKWQENYIFTKGNCFLLCGRQSGKTAAASIKFGIRAAETPKQIIMMIAFTEKQAYALFFKTLMFLRAVYPKMICKGTKKPTKHIIQLINGSQIMCYAAGLEGEGLRTYTLTSLVIDEAAPMSREVFIATMPMLSVTGGSIDVLSTPRGKAGFFYECSKRDDFTKFYVSAEDCPRHSKEFLESQKTMMSELEYAQEYLAQFLDDLKRVFSDDWIKKVCILKRRDKIIPNRKYAMGCDLARLGEDEGTIEILDYINKKNIEHVENIITKKKLTTETEDNIIAQDRLYNCRKVYIDAGAGTLGVSIFDHLLREPQTKRKVAAIDKRTRPVDYEGRSKTKVIGVDLYNNLHALGERGFLKLLKDESVIESLKSVQFENVIKAGQPTKQRFFGNYTHVVEGLIRAAWYVKEKHLNIKIHWM